MHRAAENVGLASRSGLCGKINSTSSSVWSRVAIQSLCLRHKSLTVAFIHRQRSAASLGCLFRSESYSVSEAEHWEARLSIKKNTKTQHSIYIYMYTCRKFNLFLNFFSLYIKLMSIRLVVFVSIVFISRYPTSPSDLSIKLAVTVPILLALISYLLDWLLLLLLYSLRDIPPAHQTSYRLDWLSPFPFYSL